MKHNQTVACGSYKVDRRFKDTHFIKAHDYLNSETVKRGKHSKRQTVKSHGLGVVNKIKLVFCLGIIGSSWFLCYENNKPASLPIPSVEASEPVRDVLTREQGFTSADIPRSYNEAEVLSNKINGLFSKYFASEANLMKAICQSESGLSPLAIHTNRNGSLDQGLCQINTINIKYYVGQNIFDVETNIKTAKAIRDNQGLTAWTCYKNGEYKKHL